MAQDTKSPVPMMRTAAVITRAVADILDAVCAQMEEGTVIPVQNTPAPATDVKKAEKKVADPATEKGSVL